MRALLDYGVLPGRAAREAIEEDSRIGARSPRPPAEKKPPPGIAPGRSRVLHEMQAILQRELAKIHAEPAGDDSLATEDGSRADPRVLNVYRQVLQKYIDETTTYNTILSAAKAEYEKHLMACEANAEAVLALESDIVRLKEGHKAEIAQVHREHKASVRGLEKTVETLRTELLDEKKKMKDFIAATEKTRKDAANDREQYEEMKNSCVLLTQGMTRMEENNKELVAENVEKALELQSAVSATQKSYEAVEHMRQDLQEMERKSAGLIAPEAFEDHMRQTRELRGELTSMQAAHKDLIQRYTNLKGVIDSAFERSDKGGKSAWPAPSSPTSSSSSSSSSSAMGVPSSPGSPSRRMSVNRTIVDRQNPVSLVHCLVDEGTSPRVIIEALLDEINDLRKDLKGAGGGLAVDGNDVTSEESGVDDINSPWSHFDGRGFYKDVPQYLRATGKIQNLNWSKRECEAHINDVWNAKAKREHAVAQLKKKNQEEVPESVKAKLDDYDELKDLDKFLPHYVAKKFSKAKGIEFIYNLVDSMKKYSFDIDCRLFDLILNGQVSEEIRNDQILMLSSLHEEMSKAELRIRVEPVGRLPVETFLQVIKRVNPNKGDQSFQKLKKALQIETNSSKLVDYLRIFEEDEDGNQGVFCEMMRSQHLMECLNFTEHITTTIGEVTAQDGTETTLARLREAIDLADSNMVRTEVNALLCRGMGEAYSIEDVLLKEAEKQPVNTRDFLVRLRRGLLKKSPPGGKR